MSASYAKLGDLISYQKGYAFSSSLFQNDGIPVVKVGNLGEMTVKIDDCEKISKNLALDYQSVLLQEGDIIVTSVGSRPPLFSSMVGRAVRVQNKANGSLLNQNAIRIRAKENKLDQEYLYNVLKTYHYLKHIMTIITGNANQVSISLKDLFSFNFYLPSIEEQKKIAQILSTWDEAIEAVERLIEKKKKQKKGVLQWLYSNKDNSWKKYEFGKLVKVGKKKHNPQNSQENYKCIELEHLAQESGQIIGATDSSGQNSIKSIFEPGQVLFGKLRPYLKKYAIPNFRGVCSTEIWVFDANNHITSNNFIFYLIQSHKFIYHSNVTSGTKMPRADWNYLSTVVFAIPPESEQMKFVEKVSSIDKQIRLLMDKKNLLMKQKKGLMQRLLTAKVRVN